MKTFQIFIAIPCFTLLLITSCKKDDDSQLECSAFHWEYEGEDGPEIEIDTDYNLRYAYVIQAVVLPPVMGSPNHQLPSPETLQMQT